MDERLQNRDDERGAGVEFDDEEAPSGEAPAWDMVSVFLVMFAISSLIFILVVLCFLYKRRLRTVWRTRIREFNFHRHSGTTGQRRTPQSFESSPLANQGNSEPGALEDVQLNIASSVPSPGRTQRISRVGPRNEGNVDAQENEPRQILENQPKQFPHARSKSAGGRQNSPTRETTARSEKSTFHSEQPERKCLLPSAAPSTSSTTSRQPSMHERAPRSASADSRREFKPYLPPILLEHKFYPKRSRPDPFTNPNRKEKAAARPFDETLPMLVLRLLLSKSEENVSNPEESQPGPSYRR